MNNRNWWGYVGRIYLQDYCKQIIILLPIIHISVQPALARFTDQQCQWNKENNKLSTLCFIMKIPVENNLIDKRIIKITVFLYDNVLSKT